MTIHFVYAKGLRTGAPQSITNELTARLRSAELGDVRVYDLAEVRTIVPGKGDILLGHPHPDPRTVFRASMELSGWARRVPMCPYSHGLPAMLGWVDEIVEKSDIFLAITGKYWFDTMPDTLFSHWQYKTRRLDLALDRKWYPAVKKRFGPPGGRRFLYIGHASPAKGTDYLAKLADANPAMSFAWIGGGSIESTHIETLGPCDFNLPESRELLAQYDFLLTCGRSDANPTTLLEAVSWGLVPICTPQSGYYKESWLVNIPLDDVDAASAVLRRMNEARADELNEYVWRGREELAASYTWDRFGREVIATLRGSVPEKPADRTWAERARVNKARLGDLPGGAA